MPKMFSDKVLELIIQEYEADMGEGPLDSDEVQDVINVLQVQLDYHQGNLSTDEYEEIIEDWN